MITRNRLRNDHLWFIMLWRFFVHLLAENRMNFDNKRLIFFNHVFLWHQLIVYRFFFIVIFLPFVIVTMPCQPTTKPWFDCMLDFQLKVFFSPPRLGVNLFSEKPSKTETSNLHMCDANGTNLLSISTSQWQAGWNFFVSRFGFWRFWTVFREFLEASWSFWIIRLDMIFSFKSLGDLHVSYPKKLQNAETFQ